MQFLSCIASFFYPAKGDAHKALDFCLRLSFLFKFVYGTKDFET